MSFPSCFFVEFRIQGTKHEALCDDYLFVGSMQDVGCSRESSKCSYFGRLCSSGKLFSTTHKPFGFWCNCKCSLAR